MIAGKKFWVGLGVSAGLLALFLLTVDFRRMVDALSDADYVYVAPGIALYLVAVLFRTVRWQALLRHMRPVPVARLYPVVVVGYMANNLLPMRLGEVVRSYYLGEREGVSKTSALATILVERVLDALILVLFLIVLAPFVPVVGLAQAFGDRYGVPWPLLAAAVVVPFVALFAALMMMALYPARSGRVAGALLRPLPGRLASPLGGMVSLFIEGLTALRTPRELGGLLLLSAPVWLFESGLFMLVGFSFGLDRAFDSLGKMAMAMVLVTAVSNIGSSVPAAPGGLGLFELVARETLVLLPLAAVDRSVAGAYVAVVHAALLLPMIALGQAFLWADHLSLRGLSRAGRTPVERVGEGAASAGASVGPKEGA